LLIALLSFGLSAPAQAATNPYTPQSACNHEFGGSWSTTTDGHRSLLTPSGAKWGDVYLMYNGATRYNCVATIKSVYVGTVTETDAGLLVQGESLWHDDGAYYDYYAAVKVNAANKCVQYEGWIFSPNYDNYATGGRHTWGNCG
jgi:hypothetical protein